jgi:hypothetical protein
MAQEKNNQTRTSMDRAREERQRLNKINNLDEMAKVNSYDTEAGNYDNYDANNDLEAGNNMDASSYDNNSKMNNSSDYNKTNKNSDNYNSEAGNYNKAETNSNNYDKKENQ